MRTHHACLSLACLTPLATSAPPHGPEAGSEALYGRCLEAAVARAQARLEATTEVWIDHSIWENAWQVASDHYLVRTTQTRHFAEDIAAGLETMLGHFQTVLQSDYAPEEPVPVFVFGDLAAYNEFGEDFGAEHSSFYGSFYAVDNPEQPVATYFVDNPTLLRMWITHGALHQFLDGAFTHQAPAWVAEGLASYFTVYWDYAYGVAEIERILAEPLPLRVLLDGEAADYGADAHDRLMQLAMLFTYLLQFREDTRTTEEAAPFRDYLLAILRGEDASQHALHELFDERIGELEADFRAFGFPR